MFLHVPVNTKTIYNTSPEITEGLFEQLDETENAIRYDIYFSTQQAFIVTELKNKGQISDFEARKSHLRTSNHIIELHEQLDELEATREEYEQLVTESYDNLQDMCYR